jgi:hypothetical protein
VGVVEAAEAVERGGHHALDVGGRAHVGEDELGLAACIPDGCGRGVAPVDVDVGYHNGRAFAGKARRSRPADAIGSAGHDRDLSLEASRSSHSCPP